MLAEGLQLMLVGMATVFAFLTLLVGLMAGSARFFEAYGDRFSEPEAADPAGGTADTQEEIAVVLAAIEAHRRN
jgi:sodium pump decarboxylase gamma subunit